MKRLLLTTVLGCAMLLFTNFSCDREILDYFTYADVTIVNETSGFVGVECGRVGYFGAEDIHIMCGANTEKEESYMWGSAEPQEAFILEDLVVCNITDKQGYRINLTNLDLFDLVSVEHTDLSAADRVLLEHITVLQTSADNYDIVITFTDDLLEVMTPDPLYEFF